MDFDFKSYLKKYFSGKSFKKLKILGRVKSIPWILGKNSFWTILVLIILTPIIGEALYYKYIYLSEKNNNIAPKQYVKFEEENYKYILKELEKRFGKIEGSSQSTPPPKAQQEASGPSPSPASEYITYTTSQGETLWGISQKFLGTGYRWKEIKKESGLSFTEEQAYQLLPVMKVLVPPK